MITISQYSFYPQIYRLCELPPISERKLSFVISENKQIDFIAENGKNLFMEISISNLEKKEKNDILDYLNNYFKETEELIEKTEIIDNKIIRQGISDGNAFVAESLIYDIFTKYLSAKVGSYCKLKRNYSDYDIRPKIEISLNKIQKNTKLISKIIHKENNEILYAEMFDTEYKITFPIKNLTKKQQEKAKDWFYNRGWSLWDHDRGICRQMMEEVENPSKLELESNGKTEDAARDILTIFMKVFQLPLDVDLQIDEVLKKSFL